MRKASILCVITLVFCLVAGTALAASYSTDVLETGNFGGWYASLKTFDDEFTVTTGTTFYIDIWINNGYQATTGGFWVDFQGYTDLIDLLTVELFNDESGMFFGPWSSFGGVVAIGPYSLVPDGVGLGSTLQLEGADPDVDDGIIVSRCGFKVLAVGDVDITISTVPDPDYKEWSPEPPWDDAEIDTHTITIHQIPGDADSDGIADDLDNCPDTPNGPTSGTCSRGTIGQACTNDGECGTCGFCSVNQEDSDQDDLGDVCDPDNDNDTIPDVIDNCPFVNNPLQEDVRDEDGVGDACDNCPDDVNPDQADWDCDDIGDVCEDSDQDGLNDDEDNCPGAPNWELGGTCRYGDIGKFCMSTGECGAGGDCSMDQEDTYPPPSGNGIGDACDCEADFNCDGNVDASDVTDFLTHFGRSTFFNPCTNGDPCNGDFNCDENVDAADVTKFLEDFGRSVFNDPCPACVEGDWCVYP